MLFKCIKSTENILNDGRRHTGSLLILASLLLFR